MKIKLSDNERRVLEVLIRDARKPRTEIGRDLGITSQAVGKIQEKLEKQGVIQGYTATVDYDKLGIEVFAVALFRLKSGTWTRVENDYMKERVKGPHLIKVYRFSEGEITHMTLYGFRSLKELDNYVHVLQTEKGHISELKKLYVFSASSILKDSPQELFIKVLNEGDDVLARPEKPPVEQIYPQ